MGSFNPRYGYNEQAKDAITKLCLKGDEVKSFNRELDGFPVRVHSPAQAQSMHEAIRALPHGAEDLPEELDVGDWEPPEVTILTVHNVTYNTRQASYTNVTAVMLESDTSLYPLKEELKPIGFQFAYNVHAQTGMNKWMLCVREGVTIDSIERAVINVLDKHGWAHDTAETDAGVWGEE